MNLVDLKKILDEIGYPVTYSHFTEEVKPPYVCYLVAFSSNFHADNKVYHPIQNAQVELYTAKKDLVAEEKIESVFSSHDIAWDVTETWLDNEKIFQRIYEIRVM